ncbi:MAG: MarR family transcriptional regulator [Robiginitomaculum sp.]|nr:MAG: MarR family transcriptional regulator [Robiginitomaculum sp.]
MQNDARLLFQTFTEIGIINQLARAELKQALPEGMSNAQFETLTHLNRVDGPHGPSQMATAFQVTKGAMTHTLGLLQKNGWVRVETHPTDGRGKTVEITKSGQAKYQEAQQTLYALMGELLAFTSDMDLETLNLNLEKIRVFMDAARD